MPSKGKQKRQSKNGTSETERIRRIKQLAIVAMFADDVLMQQLVLKGGNALDMVYHVASRASIDLDFSIEKDFDSPTSMCSRIRKSLQRIFNEEGYKVFDITFNDRPEPHSPEAPPFWGGYTIEFKVIEEAKYNSLAQDLDSMRRSAQVIGPANRKKFTIQISKWEYCGLKRQVELNDYMVYVYSPEMIIFEKLRAICQQMPEYIQTIGSSHQTARARDFFDIYCVIGHFEIELTSTDNISLLKDVFAAKSVPLKLIERIRDYKEFHRPDFLSVESTVKPKVKLRSFDFYFQYVVDQCQKLSEALREV